VQSKVVQNFCRHFTLRGIILRFCC